MKKWLFTIAAALALAAPSGAAAASDARLLTKFQPVTAFDASERFHPTAVDGFVADSTLEQLTATNDWVVVDPAPTADTLPTGPGVWRLDERYCSPFGGLEAESCYAAANPDAPSVVYGRVWRGSEKIVVQYWLFYDDDFYSYLYPPTGDLFQAHEGDWENVDVVLRATDEKPVAVGLSQHCTGERRSWDSTPRWQGHHPIVQVAAGSHANYFDTGEHPIAAACIPPQVLGFLAQRGLPPPADHVHGGGGAAGPADLGAQATAVVRVGNVSPAWIRYPGFWGEIEVFHAPGVGTVPAGPAPVGPAFHAVWRDPLGTLATWPES